MRLGEGKEPEEGPKEEDPRPPRPKAIGHEEDEEGEEVDTAPGGEDAARGLHQCVAQKPPGEGEFSLLREPLQENPPPEAHGGVGGEGEEEAEGEGLDEDEGQKGHRPPGAEVLGEALREPDQVEPPKPQARPDRKSTRLNSSHRL